MMRQYMEIKEKHKDALLFFRLGDFYELFFDDARIASEKLGLHLTSRETGQGKSPMCGLPHHAAEDYILRLVEAGHKVALCEQVPQVDSKNGLMERKVVRVYTPGTVFDESKNTSNYIAAIFSENSTTFGLAYADIATGDFFVTQFDAPNKLTDELHKISPKEIIANPDFPMLREVKDEIDLTPNVYHFWAFLHDFASEKLVSHFGAEALDATKLSAPSINAAGALMQNLHETQQTALSHINKISRYTTGDFMILDKSTFRNLELVETLREKDTVGTLFWAMDQTRTPMGKRLLRKWMESPLVNAKDIATRQAAVTDFVENSTFREEMRTALGKISDIERLCGKIIYWRVTARDFIALKQSLDAFTDIKQILRHASSALNTYFRENLDTLADVREKIEGALSAAPTDEGSMFAEGYDDNLDAAKATRTRLLHRLADMEQQERKSTGIKGLKVGHNKVFGYYFEVPNSQRNAAPAHYQRKQTLLNCERFSTDALKQLEVDILAITDRLIQIEQDLFNKLRKEIAQEVLRLKLSAHMVATIDVLQSMGEIAAKHNYVCPQIRDGAIEVQNGRHPVIEQLLSENFVPNDTYLDNAGNKIAIITGPNMAGKSTYLRQVALICIMAQMGSFVPASEAALPICDRVFTRIGASDDLGRGQSTFMVEMSETANILKNATRRSLIVLDEIGRGTGTMDGFSIALAIMEYISLEISAKTLFATHFHELTAAEGEIPGAVNYRMQVDEDGENITFLHKIVPGGADKSYGIFVAKLAGLPNAVIERSKEIQRKLGDTDVFTKSEAADLNDINKDIKSFRMFLEDLDEIDVDNLTLPEAIENVRKAKQAMKNLKGIWP